MGEAAAKEPSMEDILSSIRKIIAEEGSVEPTPRSEPVPDMVSETPAVEPVAAQVEEAPQVEVSEPVAYDPVVPEPIAEEIVPEQPESQAENVSLASIAASLRGDEAVASETAEPDHQPAAFEPEPVAYEPQTPVAEFVANAEPEASIEETAHEFTQPQENVSTIEMAEATPPPAAAVPAPTPADMDREEAAFRGALMSPSVDGAVTGSFDRLKRSAMDDIDAKTEAILRPMLREWLDENLPSMVERLVREEIERVARG